MKFLLWAIILLPLLLFISPFLFVLGVAIYIALYSIFFAGLVVAAIFLIWLIERLSV